MGGGGSKVYIANEEVFLIAIEMYKRKTVVAAICLAPVILANAGVLKGKNAAVAGTRQRTREQNIWDLEILQMEILLQVMSPRVHGYLDKKSTNY